MTILLRMLGFALVSLAGCGNACGSQRAEPSEPGASAAPAAASKSGAPAPRPASPEPVTQAHPAWQPAPDSELTRRLHAAQAAIETDEKFPKLASEKDLRGALGAALGAFKADGDTSSTTHQDAAAPLAVAARNYKNGDAVARVRITDTALLPSARHTVSSRLTLIGNDAAGREHGAFVRGYPAVLSQIEAQKLSRATALIGNRYLIQLTVSGTTEADAAQHLLERLDWSGLAPKQGKEPKPAP